MQGEGGFDAAAAMDAVMAIVSTWGLRVIGALVLFVVGLMVCKTIRRSVRKALTKSSLDETLVPFLSSMIYYLLLTFLTLAVLSLFFAAGVMLLIFRPFKIGDYIEAGGTAGTVQEIAIFSTTLHSPDNVRITVPNSGVYGSIVKNYSYNETRRNDMVFGISYDDDISKAVEVIQRALEGDDRVLKDPAVVIAVGELADSSVNLLVRPWCKAADYWGLRWDLTRKIKEDLEAAGCSIPYPQQDVYMHQVSAG